MVESLRSRTYAIVDTETTGTSPAYHNIIEIGILRVEDGAVARRYHTLIRPERRISHTIAGITGITNEELEGAPAFEAVAADIQEMLDGAVLVAHNARFDYSFLKAEFGRQEMPYKAKTLCTVKLSRTLYPGQYHHNLDAVMEAHGISCSRRHRAMEDAEVVWEFLQHAEADHGADKLSAAVDRALETHTLPATISRDMVRGIPNRPGVYIFYGHDGEALYVGKSVALRTRVLSHFSGDWASGRELRMCQDTARIEHIETSGELSALFLESRLVKELQPTCNRLLRQSKELAVIIAGENEDGYLAADVEYRAQIERRDFSRVFGVCRSRAQAKAFLRRMAKEHGLCNKLLGVEKGAGACFGRQIELCRGACIRAETPESYNRRTRKAFEKHKIRAWPFAGAIVVRDEHEEGEGTAYVVDQWCLMEIVSYSQGHVSRERVEAVFDLDSYRILSRFLLDERKSKGLVSMLSDITSLGEAEAVLD